ncbi:hypothetical protein FH972_026050 [Carpinus fangiana]|uniref:Uncharacterized protein n=1 Tax=Carpinus fangiana TaxID=176857 RepID=A0A5N6L3S8_9ROSI|nr:hypothetical protein FH972_026050 [Carpinus fangiana]
MSLARAFTRRLGRGEKTQAENTKQRPQISLPMALTETTNMLAYDAPDIEAAQFQHTIQSVIPNNSPFDSGASTPYSEPNSSGRSSNDDGSRRQGYSPITASTEYAPGLTDASSVESSPVAEKNHLTEYFPAVESPTRSKTTRVSSSSASSISDGLAPTIPRRAASHSKREHERVARSRSLNRASSHSRTRTSVLAEKDNDASGNSPTTTDRSASPAPESEWRTSFDILGRSGSLINRTSSTRSSERHSGSSTPTRSLSASRAERRPAHPFSQELEQLNEVAEDVTGLDDALEAFHDEEIMTKFGLVKYTADEYTADLYRVEGIFPADGETRIAHVGAEGMQGWI